MNEERSGRLLVLHNASQELLNFVNALTRLDLMQASGALLID